jgi:hypothetical protein
MPEAKESTIRKLVGEIIIGLLVAILIEPTIKALNLERLIPYLPKIWSVILTLLTLNALRRWKRLKDWTTSFCASSRRWNKIVPYTIIGGFGICIFIGYCWAMTAIFAKRESATKPLSEKLEAKKENSSQPKPAPQGPAKSQAPAESPTKTHHAKAKKTVPVSPPRIETSENAQHETLPNEPGTQKTEASVPTVRVTSFQVLPYVPGKPLQIKMHVLNSGGLGLEAEILSNAYGVSDFDPNAYDKRKALEDEMWRRFDAGLLLKKTHEFLTFPVGQDVWVLIDSMATLTANEVAGNSAGKVVYFLSRIADKQGLKLLESCIWVDPRSRGEIMYCIEHN